MAVLGIEGLFPAQLIFDPAAVTAAFVADIEVRVIFVHLVRRPRFPVVEAHLASGSAERSYLYRSVKRIQTQ